ncbi:uncharacterized protein [Musca autumnalis]|uniref:uncharacterized protein n=1 Tax=Musca autumnalis TaxID=221902 RepID=UPI003CF1E54A
MSESEHEQENETTNIGDKFRPRKRSLVWQLFEKLTRYRVRCRLCGHEQNYQGTTGNILRHLKSKHELDATIKGQQDPHHQERLRLLLSNLPPQPYTIPAMEIKVERNFKVRKNSFNDTMPHENGQQDGGNPYGDDDNDDGPDNNYIPEEPFENYLCPEEPPIDPVSDDEWGNQNVPTTSKRKVRSQLDEERVIAETEYFREKAAYFKLQRHLTALQAKKIRIEIEQLTKQNNSVT